MQSQCRPTLAPCNSARILRTILTRRRTVATYEISERLNGMTRKQRRRQEWLWNNDLGRPSRTSAALAAQPVRYQNGADPHYRVRTRFDGTAELVYRAPRRTPSERDSKCITTKAPITLAGCQECNAPICEPRLHGVGPKRLPVTRHDPEPKTLHVKPEETGRRLTTREKRAQPFWTL